MGRSQAGSAAVTARPQWPLGSLLLPVEGSAWALAA